MDTTTTTPEGKLVFHVFAALAEFERLAWREPGDQLLPLRELLAEGAPSAENRVSQTPAVGPSRGDREVRVRQQRWEKRSEHRRTFGQGA